MSFDPPKIYKSVALLLGIFLFVALFTKINKQNQMTLSEYEQQHPKQSLPEEYVTDDSDDAHNFTQEPPFVVAEPDTTVNNASDTLPSPSLIGETLNDMTQFDNRTTLSPGFYYEPLSDNLKRYMTGISFPTQPQEEQAISLDDLRYVHVRHYDFDGRMADGELVCHHDIAQDLVEIFYELFRNEYAIEKIKLIDEYNGDDEASMEDNNTSCFNYRTVSNSSSLSKHALGLAIDINPLYNPYITYAKDGSEQVAPVSASAYADRTQFFAYKIDETDLCYKLFTQHGFTWGGNWNSCKDYQHFQKPH